MFIFFIAVSGFGLNYLLKYMYPNYYNRLMMYVMYQLIYYYSSVEMVYLKVYKHNFKRLTSTSTSNTKIEFIKNGKPVDFEEDCDCDFMIYSQNNEKQIFKAGLKERTFIKSGVSFILFTIALNNETISLKLSGDDYNYYLVGNVIDNCFLLYFLNKYYNLRLNGPLVNYTLNIIDNNVNIYSVTYPECFEILHDGIRIFSKDFGKITNNQTFDPLYQFSETRSVTEEEKMDPDPIEEEKMDPDPIEEEKTDPDPIEEEKTDPDPIEEEKMETPLEEPSHPEDVDNYDFLKDSNP